MSLLKKKSKAKKKKAALKKRCVTVRDRKTGRRKRVCKPVRKPTAARKPAPRTPAKPAPLPQPLPNLPVPSAAAAPVVPPPAPVTATPATPAIPPVLDGGPLDPPTPVQQTFGPAQAERLLWRAGFGPRPGDVEALAQLPIKDAVASLTRVSGTAALTGAAPRDENGNPIDPRNAWGHDHVWWLDRMVRSNQPLVERMTLIWHDWWATSNADVGDQGRMLDQNELFRANALGSFAQLATAVTKDPAMLIFLNGIDNRKGRPNENYGRELMELFTLGADRGAYTETDVRELARALTGWRADWIDGYTNFRFDANRRDTGVKTLWQGTPYQRSGDFGWQDAVMLCLQHPFHASFFVRKLWSYFIPTPPDADTQAKLEQLYVDKGFAVRPVVEAILLHPDLYAGAPLVKPPAVYVAGLLRSRGQTVTTSAWSWLGTGAGQQLFYPPNVSGWNDQAWLDTSTLRGRWQIVSEVLRTEYVQPSSTYDPTETPETALDRALAFWGRPTLSDEARAELLRYCAAAIPSGIASWQQGYLRAQRQNALRQLIATSPDFQIA